MGREIVPPEIVLIANPTSGARRAPDLATRVTELLKAKGKSVELRITECAGDAKRLAADAVAHGVQTVTGCGGDGTLQEIAESIRSTPTALAIVPSGRCNDFAGAIGLKRSDPVEKFVSVIAENKRRAFDIGTMGERCFLTVATLGFDSEVSRFVETRKLWLKGSPAYFYAVMRVLISFNAPSVRLKGDFGTYEGRILLAATGNTPCYGGAMRITPGAIPDDGMLEVCVIKNVSRLTVLRVLPRVLSGTHVTHPAVSMFKTRTLEIETLNKPQWICADGESLGHTPCKFGVQRAALNVVVPSTA